MADDPKNVIPMRRPKRKKVTPETAIQSVLDSGVEKFIIVGEDPSGSGVVIFSTELTNAEMIFLIEYSKIALLMGED